MFYIVNFYNDWYLYVIIFFFYKDKNQTENILKLLNKTIKLITKMVAGEVV